MKFKIEAQPDFLLAKASGKLSFSETLDFCKRAADRAVEHGLGKVLVDCLELQSNLTVPQRFQCGHEMAAYLQARRTNLKIAVVGVPPAVDGFAVLVLQNRGGNVKLFASVQEARAWLAQD